MWCRCICEIMEVGNLNIGYSGGENKEGKIKINDNLLNECKIMIFCIL